MWGGHSCPPLSIILSVRHASEASKEEPAFPRCHPEEGVLRPTKDPIPPWSATSAERSSRRHPIRKSIPQVCHFERSMIFAKRTSSAVEEPGVSRPPRVPHSSRALCDQSGDFDVTHVEKERVREPNPSPEGA